MVIDRCLSYAGKSIFARKTRWIAVVLGSILSVPLLHAAAPDGQRKIVLIAGSKSHGVGMHEYLKSVRLMKVLLDRAPNLKGVETTVIYDGWPADTTVLDAADTIVFFSDGMQWSPWTFTPERVALLQKEMDRGCGLMTFHFATYIPNQFQRQGMEWNGGYIEYDGPKFLKYPQKQFFTQKVLTTDVVFPSPGHVVMSGVKPFHVKDEFYYRGTFAAKGVTPLLRIPELPADPAVFPGPPASAEDQVVMWAYDRPRAGKSKVAGRSVGATFGHFYVNWQNDDYRKLILNAIVWTAHVPVPKEGVASLWVEDAEVERVLGAIPTPVKDPLEPAK